MNLKENAVPGGDPAFVLFKQFSTPAPVSSLALGHASHLFAGSDDGSLRVYDLSTFKVVKAVRALGDVSSIVCMKRPGSELRDAWIAHGTHISKFQLDSPKMIQIAEDAIRTIKIGETDKDVVNELALNANKSHLAFALDSGDVGVVDLTTDAVTKMKKKHESISGCVQFIPDRPREIVSGGFDTALLHFDFSQGELLSELKMAPYTAVTGMSLSPPFIMATAMSPSGVLAAGMADGRLWVSFTGEKKSTGKGRKKSKKWEGLNEDETLLIKIAEGPIVAMSFSEARLLALSTLLGTLMYYDLIYDTEDGNVILQRLWQGKCQGIEKVNTLISDDKRIIVGGLSKAGRGVTEVWKRNIPASFHSSLVGTQEV